MLTAVVEESLAYLIQAMTAVPEADLLQNLHGFFLYEEQKDTSFAPRPSWLSLEWTASSSQMKGYGKGFSRLQVWDDRH